MTAAILLSSLYAFIAWKKKKNPHLVMLHNNMQFETRNPTDKAYVKVHSETTDYTDRKTFRNDDLHSTDK
jgi:hypothetical protein